MRLGMPLFRWKIMRDLRVQGIGKHTPEEVEDMVKKDLAAISLYLGEKSLNDCGYTFFVPEFHSHFRVLKLITGKENIPLLSTGEKPFLMGDEPSEVDCTVFGFLAQLKWHYPGSPYEAMLEGEF